VNCCAVPTAIEGFAGVTAIETSVGAATESVVDPVMELDVAEIVVAPAASPFARPPLDMPAMRGDDDVHVAAAVTSFVLPSL
jgi:hypothetical protein